MSPLASILPIAVFILLFYTFYIIRHNRKAKKTVETFINDDSYIESIDHLSGQVGFRIWQQYDVLLAAQMYGWDAMVAYAAYLETADLQSIDSLRVCDPSDSSDTELAHVYNQQKGGLAHFDQLTQEHGMLSIAGRSRTLNDDVKLVFYNQTRGLRLFTPINDETLVRKYVETLLRRTFGTPDAMKLAVRQTAQS